MELSTLASSPVTTEKPAEIGLSLCCYVCLGTRYQSILGDGNPKVWLFTQESLFLCNRRQMGPEQGAVSQRAPAFDNLACGLFLWQDVSIYQKFEFVTKCFYWTRILSRLFWVIISTRIVETVGYCSIRRWNKNHNYSSWPPIKHKQLL